MENKILVLVDFWAEKNPDDFSAAIMQEFGTPYSHVAFRYQNRDGEWRVFHATIPVVADEPFEPMLNESLVVRSFPVELPCHPEYFFGFVEGACGKEYSMLQAAQLGLRGRRDINGNTKMICSELVGRKLVRFGVISLAGVPDIWSPLDLENALIQKFGVQT